MGAALWKVRLRKWHGVPLCDTSSVVSKKAISLHSRVVSLHLRFEGASCAASNPHLCWMQRLKSPDCTWLCWVFSVGLSQKYFRISALLALNCSSTCFIQVYPIISWSFWWASIRVVAFDTWSWWRCCWKSGFLFEILGSCQWSSKRRCRYPIQIQSKSCGSYVGICCEVQRWQFWAYRSSCRSGLQANIGTSSQLWQ